MKSAVSLLAFPGPSSDDCTFLLDYVSVCWFKRFMKWAFDVKQLFPNSHSARLGTFVISLLFDDLVDRHLSTFRDPLFIIWMFRAETAILDQNENDLESLSRCLPFSILPALTDAGSDFCLETEVALPSVRWTTIPRSGYSIRAEGSDLTCSLSVCRNEASLLLGGEVLLSCIAEKSKATMLVDHVGNGVQIIRRPMLQSKQGLYELSEVPEVLGGCNPKQWKNGSIGPCVENVLNEALSLIKDVWPEGYLDVVTFSPMLVSLETANGSLGSVCNRALPFAVGASFAQSDALGTAELLLHEVAHLKIDIAQSIDSLILDSGAKIHNHPWRNDFRSITGVLYAAHAFLTTLALNVKLHNSCQQRYAITRDLCRLEKDVETTLAYLRTIGSFTSLGEGFMDHLFESYELVKQSWCRTSGS